MPNHAPTRPITAYVLDLFGAPEQPAYGWQRPYYAWTWTGMVMPLDEDAKRQNAMLRADTGATR